MSTLSSAVSALNANSVGIQATAQNIANVSTNNYDSVQARIQTNSTNTGVNAYIQQQDRATFSTEGQQLASQAGNLESLTQNVASAQPSANSLESTTLDVSNTENAQSLSTTTDSVANAEASANSLQSTTESVASTESSQSLATTTDSVANNDVDFAREFTNSTTYQRGFEANGVTVQTEEEMLGTVVNMMA